MFKTLLTLILVALLSVVTYAGDLVITGCTKDSHIATLHVGISDEAKPSVVMHISQSFSDTASKFSDEDLVGPTGYQAFHRLLTQEDLEAITSMYGKPAVDLRSTCKASK